MSVSLVRHSRCAMHILLVDWRSHYVSSGPELGDEIHTAAFSSLEVGLLRIDENKLEEAKEQIKLARLYRGFPLSIPLSFKVHSAYKQVKKLLKEDPCDQEDNCWVVKEQTKLIPKHLLLATFCRQLWFWVLVWIRQQLNWCLPNINLYALPTRRFRWTESPDLHMTITK